MKFVLRRRKFFSLVGGAAAWPLAANAQRQTAKLPTIGYLGPTSPENKGRNTSAFLQRLRELVWSDDRSVTIRHRRAQAHPERAADFSARFLRPPSTVTVTRSTKRSHFG